MDSGADSSSLHGPDTGPERSVFEMTELVGGLAHELRNPLSTMMIHLKLLGEDLEDLSVHPEDARRRALLKVGVLSREASRLQNLFDEFLKLTGSQSDRRELLSVNELVSGLAEFIKPQAADQQIRVEVSLADESPVCRANEQSLRQALLNIIINARQAMPEGGVLRLATAVEGGEVAVSVSDTGMGIAEQDRERILRPFYSTRAEGNGLGLSIAQRIVREHGGTLTFKSKPGQGATFWVRLPQESS